MDKKTETQKASITRLEPISPDSQTEHRKEGDRAQSLKKKNDIAQGHDINPLKATRSRMVDELMFTCH